jgi:hypothetical protein
MKAVLHYAQIIAQKQAKPQITSSVQGNKPKSLTAVAVNAIFFLQQA